MEQSKHLTAQYFFKKDFNALCIAMHDNYMASPWKKWLKSFILVINYFSRQKKEMCDFNHRWQNRGALGALVPTKL